MTRLKKSFYYEFKKGNMKNFSDLQQHQFVVFCFKCSNHNSAYKRGNLFNSTSDVNAPTPGG